MKKDNKGFSLVELIIVIAIMAVLVGVLAPQFIKYVEQSRRSRDIQTAQEIREACLADIADGSITGSSFTATVSGGTFSTFTENPTISGNKANHGGQFYVEANPTLGTCSVYESSSKTYNLTTESGASNYKLP
jgi:type IV pilus assembly protein PilA